MTNERIELLERLSRLRDSGALTQDEFEREKTKLFESDAKPESVIPPHEPVFSSSRAARAPKGDGKRGGAGLLIGSVAVLALVGAGAFFYLNQRNSLSQPLEAERLVAEQVEDAQSVVPVEPSANPEPVRAGTTTLTEAMPETRPVTHQAEPILSGGFADFRTRIRQGWTASPDLAGRFVVIRWGCGTSCTTGVVGDKSTGRLHWLNLGGEDYPSLTLDYSVNSDRVTARWENMDKDLCMTQNFRWNGSTMIESGPPRGRPDNGEGCAGG